MNGEKKDRFNQRTTWITRVQLDKPFEVRDDTVLCVLTAKDGFSIRSKIFPDNDHKELYDHADIKIGTEPTYRHINTHNTEIGGVAVKLMRKGTCMEFKSDSATTGQQNFVMLEKQLLNEGFKITGETTERCEKESCKIRPKKVSEPSASPQ